MKVYYFQSGSDGGDPKHPSPMPRRRAVGMHPGWECFLCALGAGFFMAMSMLATVQFALHRIPFGYVAACTVMWMALFIIGGRKAERLMERKS